MTDPVELTDKQKQFLAHACAFIAAHPAREELDQLLTLAAMLLPEPLVKMLANRAAGASRTAPDDPSFARSIQ